MTLASSGVLARMSTDLTGILAHFTYSETAERRLGSLTSIATPLTATIGAHAR